MKSIPAKDEFADFEPVSAHDEFSGDEFAAADEESTRKFTPAELQERLRLQRQLKVDLAASDAADEHLADVEGTAEIARPFLRGAVDLADGVLGLPRLIATPPVAAYNVLTGSNVQLPINQSVADVRSGARNVLAARSDDEQLASTVTRGLGGVLGGVGFGGLLGAGAGAGSTAANVGTTLAANPALQTAGAVTGGLASEAARQAGGGPLSQLAAGFAGGAAPSFLQAGLSAATRGAIRGGEAGRARVEQSLEDFGRSGTTPSVGQATQNRFLQAAETLLSRIPGSAGRMAKKAESQAEEIGAGIESTSGRLAGRTSAEETGRKISAGIEDDFVPRFKAEQGVLYGAVDNLIPADSSVSVSNTQTALKELTKVNPGAAATTARLVNTKIKQIADDLAADAGTSGVVPYSALKDLRTRIGEQLDSGLVTDVPAKQWKRLYAGLSEDLGEAATKAGPDAKRAFDIANKHTKDGYARLELLDEVARKAAKPEDVYLAAISGTSQGATRLRAVMDSIPLDAQKAVSATLLRRLGRAVNSQQDELSEKFSTETFLSNWGKLSTEAKDALFSRFGSQYRRDIDAISKVASNLRQGSQVFKNPSGTAQGGAQIATASAATAALGALVHGNPWPALSLGGALTGAHLSARLLTNPRFVRWLAVSTKLPQSVYTSQLNQLQRIGERNEDPILIEAAAYLKKQGSEEQKDRADQQRRKNERSQ